MTSTEPSRPPLPHAAWTLPLPSIQQVGTAATQLGQAGEETGPAASGWGLGCRHCLGQGNTTTSCQLTHSTAHMRDGTAEAPQLIHRKLRAARPAALPPCGDGVDAFVSEHWEPRRLFPVPGKPLPLLVYLSSLFLEGSRERLFWLDGGLPSSKSCTTSPPENATLLSPLSAPQTRAREAGGPSERGKANHTPSQIQPGEEKGAQGHPRGPGPALASGTHYCPAHSAGDLFLMMVAAAMALVRKQEDP